MIVRTCMSSISENGYKLSALKSGICKYYRRGEADKFKWCVMEMARFRVAEGNTKGILTNLVNRLKILLMEEIHASEVGILLKAIDLLDRYDKDRDRIELLLEYCDLVVKARRTRSVSYLNNWWKNHCEDIILEDDVEWQNAKKGDSETLTNLAENVGKMIVDKDEEMFGGFCKLLNLDEKAGRRYRRTDPVYVWWELIETYMKDELRPIFDFALNMFFRKNMTERPAFGIWMGIFLWRSDHLCMESPHIESYTKEDMIAYYRNMEKLILDDYVMKDYHVDKSLGLEHFALNGAWVKDEDMSLLDDPEKYKNYYIEKKVEADKEKKKTRKRVVKVMKKKVDKDVKKKVVKKGVKKEVKKTVKKKRVKKAKVDVKDVAIDRKISFEDLSDIFVIEEGVCGGKVPCIIVRYEGKKYIIKMMGESMNYGADYLVIDKAKSLFGLRDMNMKRILCDRKIARKDKSCRTFVNNWEFIEEDAIYCMMDYFESVGDLGKNKKYLKDESVANEALKIRLFDGLFRSSDNILRNILVDKEGELLSIDEGDMFGKRKLVFNKRGDYTKKITSKERVGEMIDEMMVDKERKVESITDLMNEYGLDYGDECKGRFENYKEIVVEEWL